MVRNKAIMVKYGLTVIKADRKIIEDSFEVYKKSGIWGLNGGLNKKGFDLTIKLGVDTGELKKPITYKEVVSTKYVDGFLKEFGRE
jgi:hypothetical protein